MADGCVYNWSIVVLTCQHKDSVYAFQRELEIRQQRGILPAGALLLTVPDPQEHVGSGGATLNALLVAAEHLSARDGYTVVTADVLYDAHILILHTGRDFPWDGCSRAFCWMPISAAEQSVEGPVCCLDMLLNCLSTKVCAGSPPGVWVCSTDMILSISSIPTVPWEDFAGVRAVSLPGDTSFAVNHGVYLTDAQGGVRDIIYRGSEERIRSAALPDGKVPLVSGPVFFSGSVSEKLLQTLVTPPLDGCTYLGMDSGALPLQISLFLDILLCLCSDPTEAEFVNGVRAGSSSPTGPRGEAVKSARAVLWRTLRGVPLSLAHASDGRYDYLTASGKEHIVRLTEAGSETRVLSHIQELQCVSEDGRIINSVLEGEVHVAAGAVVQHCHLQGPIQVNSGCLLSGLDQTVSDQLRHLPLTSDIIVQGHRVNVGELKLTVFTVFGAYDSLEAQSDDVAASFLNQTWSRFFSSTGIQREDLWGEASRARQTLLDARLFLAFMPKGGTIGLDGVRFLLGGSGSIENWRSAWRLSLREVLSLTDQQRELQWREKLLFRAGRRRAADTLKSHAAHNLLPSMRAAVLGGKHTELLSMLDSVASSSLADLGVAARTLACIADVLGCMAGEGKGGLRSGPAANPSWASAFSLLEQGKLEAGVLELANQRARWLDRPELLVRAARHYEGAGQILLRKAVMSARQFVLVGQGEIPPMGEWQEVECPARLDLSGGWSDTPPIAFEYGGVVVNVAVKVDGKRPIGARARRIPEPRLVLSSRSGTPDCSVTTQTVCNDLADLKDYCQPHAPGALLKAVCLCSDVVCLTSPLSLEQQLIQRWGGGLELHSWSQLPHGSGLGTSSILAGAVLAAVYRCTGRSYDTSSLIHAVLHLEQILTTGGGWQDQVGGLVGGVKVARSRPILPLRVDVERLMLPPDFLVALQQRLLLIYTGKTRLARNLLQDVVRNWYSRLPSIVRNAEQLVSNAEECARACMEGSLTKLGDCMNRYWQQKKAMAPGCEPAAVRTMMEALHPRVLGQSLAGAGGGGFLFILTRDVQQEENVRQVLNSTQGLCDFSVHSVQIDTEGITVVHQGTGNAQCPS
ncbi:L-fucose kinase isoform X1 [Ictalurus furcatus]|uniref:L-fucose kinase isoform X1 n=1 Tax=Ictalurus furcatus TaxID=66913 RepID=UPI0023504F13|nr:L-fucose kinase isoform X1 [Ictalurus furcatus]XP_053497719.1 L-fucose kinase isoform X1 [Ictalurus furcatus]